MKPPLAPYRAVILAITESLSDQMVSSVSFRATSFGLDVCAQADSVRHNGLSRGATTTVSALEVERKKLGDRAFAELVVDHLLDRLGLLQR